MNEKRRGDRGNEGRGRRSEALVGRLTSEEDEKQMDKKKHSRNQGRKPRGSEEGRRRTGASRW